MADRASARERGYGTAWEKARAGHLRSHPWCRKCAAVGQQIKAVVVDHIEPHRGDQGRFWDRSNWQSLCKRHHDSTKQREEHRGYSGATDADGWPTDPRHPGLQGRR